MTNGKSDRKKLTKIVGSIILVVALLFGIDLSGVIPNMNQQEETQASQTYSEDEQLMLYMFDVGQADSFLFVQNGETALIDCGTRSTGKDVVENLKQLGIKRIDYLFGTHPHDDHMGGMYDVISNFEIGKIILPKVKNGEVTTNWYLKLMKKIKDDKYNLEYVSLGEIYHLGNATMKVIGPVSEVDDGNKNNYSTVLKVTFGEMDIIMTGDAEAKVERQIIESGEDLDAEILKVGHHGSDTSTSDEFLEALSPDYALISSEVGNKYNHPTKVTMEKLQDNNIVVYRTDESGTVVITITQDSASFSCEPGDYLSGPELEERSAE